MTHEHELRIEEHVVDQRDSFAERLERISVEVRVRREYFPLPRDMRLAVGVRLADVELTVTGYAGIPVMQLMILDVTLNEDERAAYLALREQIIRRALAALEVPS